MAATRPHHDAAMPSGDFSDHHYGPAQDLPVALGSQLKQIGVGEPSLPQAISSFGPLCLSTPTRVSPFLALMWHHIYGSSCSKARHASRISTERQQADAVRRAVPCAIHGDTRSAQLQSSQRCFSGSWPQSMAKRTRDEMVVDAPAAGTLRVQCAENDMRRKRWSRGYVLT